MEKLLYYLDDQPIEIAVGANADFLVGEEECLSTERKDISYGQPWYNEGFSEITFLTEADFDKLKGGIEKSISKIVSEVKNQELVDFSLERYHQVITSDEDHLKVVTRTRDLFSPDFVFPIQELVQKLNKAVGFELTDVNPMNGEKIHIIVRINRPGSNDFNPPHKDIYEGVDEHGFVPPFMNFWIPIAGVTEKSNLPLAPGSHLMNESLILRTRDGAEIEGKKYRVRAIKSWGGGNHLQRSKVTYGQILVFSSHLVHGLAVNKEMDMTRVALEFRLFRK